MGELPWWHCTKLVTYFRLTNSVLVLRIFFITVYFDFGEGVYPGVSQYLGLFIFGSGEILAYIETLDLFPSL